MYYCTRTSGLEKKKKLKKKLYLFFFSFEIIGMEVIWERKDTWAGGSKNEKRGHCGEGCVTSNQCGIYLPSASWEPKTSHVRNCCNADMQSWIRHSGAASVFGATGEKGWDFVLGYNIRAFPFSHTKRVTCTASSTTIKLRPLSMSFTGENTIKKHAWAY